jgi:hypothetical protein
VMTNIFHGTYTEVTMKPFLTNISVKTVPVITTMLCIACGCHAADYKPGELAPDVAPSNLEQFMDDGMLHYMERLKDPDSAKFRNVYVLEIASKDGKPLCYAVCGQVNAKNSYGGYNGFGWFISVRVPGTSEFSSIDESPYGSAEDLCAGFGRGYNLRHVN